MRGVGGLGVGLWLGWVGVASAGSLVVMWEFPPDYPAPPTFLLSVTNDTGMPEGQPLTVQRPGACLQYPGATATNWCAVTTCPAPGNYTFWLVAVAGNVSSRPSNLVTCAIDGGNPCHCTVLDDTIPSTDGTPPTTADPAPDPDPQPETPPVEEIPAATNDPKTPHLDLVRGVDGSLVMAWTYPRTPEARPLRFIVALTSTEWGEGSEVLFAVPPHDVTQCALVGGAGNSWCARLGCPGVGHWWLTVRAEGETTLGAVSNKAGCVIGEQGQGCACGG